MPEYTSPCPPSCAWKSELNARLAFFPCLWKNLTSIIPLLHTDPSNGLLLHWHAFQFGKPFFPFLHLPWKCTVAYPEQGFWLFVMLAQGRTCTRRLPHARPTHGADSTGSSAPHPALGYALIQQAPQPCSVAATSCSKHALCFVSGGGVAEAQGILYH